ncbi:MAG TPA: hypothetical protein VFR49_04445 [Solirubrobacteraceae bacterium]|nr:hypothetical protein [Solirubrobacteraceae bacterium]
MSSTPITPTPRLLLFPQVGGSPEGTDGRPTVRRYTLTRLPGARRPGPGAGAPGKPARI